MAKNKSTTEVKTFEFSPDMLTSWNEQIGHYSTESQPSVNDVLGNNEAARAALYEGTVEKQSTEARKAFIDHLSEVAKVKLPSDQNPIKLETLLGPEGVKKYKAAVKEEAESRAFRDAVLSASTTHYKGPKWDQKMVLHVGGPSASGKTYASKMLVKEMAENLPKNPNNQEGNHVVSIDGGVERELSQMRNLVLQTALSKGYKGIKDLHSNTKLGIKGKIKKAAKQANDLSMVIPATFTNTLNPMVKRKVRSEMKAWDQDPNTKQIFSFIDGGKDEKIKGEPNSKFQKQVELMGNSRAWHEGKPPDHEKIALNETPASESKNYEKQYYSTGVNATRRMQKFVEKNCANTDIVAYKSDLLHLKRTPDGQDWTICDPKEPFNPESKIYHRMSAQDFKVWKQEKNEWKTKNEAWVGQGKPTPPPKPLNQWKNTTDKQSPVEVIKAVGPKQQPPTTLEGLEKLASMLGEDLSTSATDEVSLTNSAPEPQKPNTSSPASESTRNTDDKILNDNEKILNTLQGAQQRLEHQSKRQSGALQAFRNTRTPNLDLKRDVINALVEECRIKQENQEPINLKSMLSTIAFKLGEEPNALIEKTQDIKLDQKYFSTLLDENQAALGIKDVEPEQEGPKRSTRPS